MTETEAKTELGPVRRLVVAVAGRLGCTEGQVQTVAIGLVVALVGFGFGIPPVLDDEPAASAQPAPATAGQAATPVGGPAAGGDTAAPPASTPLGAPPSPARPPASGQPTPDDPTPQASTPPAPSSGGEPASAVGVPGLNGACGIEERSLDNPRHAAGAAAAPVWIYEPTGSADATITGGRCDDDRRPAVFLAHGFGQTDPVAYEELIEHLVSVGNVVVYPTYEVADGSRSTLEESTRVVDAGIVAAVDASPRIDTSRVGWWGHSHGGGMIPYLAQQGGGRGWGEGAFWMSMVAQAYSQLVGTEAIAVATNAQAMTVAFEQDGFADARLGIDVFESLVLPDAQKRHVTVRSGTYGGGPFLAEHGAPAAADGQADAVDVLLWRYADLLETCALHGLECAADLTTAPDPDGTPQQRAVVSTDPVDVGPAPVVLAECDAVFGPTLNPRIQRCGPTRL